MDNSHFAKLCRDSKIIGKNCTTTDIDIVFKKVVIKGERRIDFQQFQQTLFLLAQIKFAGDADGLNKIQKLVLASEPAKQATEAKAGGIYAKLTDTSLYTGSHKLRFDKDGKGKGLDGRDTVVHTSELSQIVNRKSGTMKRSVSGSLSKLDAAKPADAADTPRKLSRATSKKSLSASSGSVYDRLTDTTGYTGSHKHRFDKDGKGKGLEGRDTGALGSGTHSGKYRGEPVHNLTQILRK